MKHKRIKSFSKTVVVFFSIIILLFLGLFLYLKNIHSWQCSYEFPILRLKTLDERLKRCYNTLQNWDNPATQDWEIYEGNNFVFKHPSNWNYEGAGQFKMVKGSKVYYIGIDGLGNNSFEQIINRKQDNLDITQQKELTLDGKRAKRSVTILHQSGNNYKDINYIVEEKRNEVFIVHLSLHEPEDAEVINTFDLMMSTLNFPD